MPVLKRNHFAAGHGIGLKAASLGTKFLFLALVVPILAEGTYATFLTLQTISLICGRIGLLGVDNQIVTDIRGSRRRASLFLAPYTPVVLASCLMFILYWFIELEWIIGLSLALSVGATFYLAGAIRSVSVESFELGMNIPPIAFFAASFLIRPETGADLLAIFVASQLLSHIVSLGRARVLPARVSAAARILRRLRRSLAKSLPKLGSGVIQIVHLRAFIVWPTLLPTMAVVTDSLALAVAYAEAVWQMAMVFVHRDFARYVTTRDGQRPIRDACRSSLVMAVLSSLWIVPFALGMPDFVVEKTTLSLLFTMSAVNIAVIAFIQFRFYLWTRDRSWLVLACDAAVVIGHALIFMMVREYFVFVPLISILFAIIFGVLVHKIRQ